MTISLAPALLILFLCIGGELTDALLRGVGLSSPSAAVDEVQAHNNEEKHHRKLPPAWKNQCKINGEKIGIYVGGGTGSSSKLWAEALAVFWQTGNRGPNDPTKLNVDGGNTFTGSGATTYVTLTDNEFDNCYNGELNALDVLVMPGGSAYLIQDTLGGEGKDRYQSSHSMLDDAV